MTKPTENKPEAVPERATRDGEILLRWSWVEPRVWTERMLTALEDGGQRRQMVQLDRQGPSRANLASGVLSSRR